MYTQMTVLIRHSRVTSAGKLTVNACVNVTEHVHNNKDISKNLSELMTGEWWIMQKNKYYHKCSFDSKEFCGTALWDI